MWEFNLGGDGREGVGGELVVSISKNYPSHNKFISIHQIP